MLPGTPEYAQPLAEVEGAVWNSCTRLFVVSRTIWGLVTQSATVEIVDCEKDPVPGLKTSSSSCGRVLSVDAWSRLVLTAANTRPELSACSCLTFRWSSAWPLPWIAGWRFHDDEALGLVPSVRQAHHTDPVSWSLHITPSLFLPKATIAEMSSGAGCGLETGIMKGVAQPVPPGLE